MENLSMVQKLYLIALSLIGGAWFLLLIGVPIFEFRYGRTPLTVFLSTLIPSFLIALLAVAGAGFVLQAVGVFPRIATETTIPNSFGPIRTFRNLAMWIVIALLLVFAFNLFQGSGGVSHPTSSDVAQSSRSLSIRNNDGNLDIVAIIVNWFPMLLLIGVWMFFLRKMQKNKDQTPPDRP